MKHGKYHIVDDNTNEWECDHLGKLCRGNRILYLDTLACQGDKSMKWSAWLRLMGLIETWDIKDG